MVARDKRSTLLRKFVNYDSKKFFGTSLDGVSFIKQSGANVIKLFYLYFTNFHTKLEGFLEAARKACQGQTIEPITEARKIRTKKVYNVGPWGSIHKTSMIFLPYPGLIMTVRSS